MPTTVLLQRHAQTPSAVQSCHGHTEGAAGITGALLAIAVLTQHSSPPLVNLRQINPHVEAAFGDWRKRAGAAVAVPRQLQPQPSSMVSMSHVCLTRSRSFSFMVPAKWAKLAGLTQFSQHAAVWCSPHVLPGHIQCSRRGMLQAAVPTPTCTVVEHAGTAACQQSLLEHACFVQEQGLAGTSSFGMSGVNAHALLGARPMNSEPQPVRLSWRRERTWPAPPRLALLAACTPSMTADRASVAFAADLGSAALSYLHDHQVSCVCLRPAGCCLEQ